MLSVKRISWCCVVLIGVGTFLGGCDNTLSPFAEDAGLYSVYGYLSFSGSNFIRVKDLNTPPTSDSSQSLDATVRLKNLQTGRSETLADSVVVFDGVYTHNFRMRQPVKLGDTYRLTVERSDGRQAKATATMPRGTLNIEPPRSDTVDCTDEILFNFQNSRKQSSVSLAVAVFWEGGIQWDNRGMIDKSTTLVPANVVFQALPNYELTSIDPEQYCALLDNPKLRIAYTQYGPDWPADSVFADPTSSRIENGLGVFGGLRQDTVRRYVDISGE